MYLTISSRQDEPFQQYVRLTVVPLLIKHEIYQLYFVVIFLFPA